MKKLLAVLSVAVAIIAFSGVVVYGSTWMNWNGDAQIQQSSNEVEEILNILEQVNQDKLRAEEDLRDLENSSPSGLARQNRELRNENSALKEDLQARDDRIKELEDLIKQLGPSQQSHNNRAAMNVSMSDKDAVDDSTEIETITEERDSLQTAVDDLNREVLERDEEIASLTESEKALRSSVDNLNDKVLGLEAEVHTQSSLITELNSTIENLNARISSLEAELEAERNSNSSNVNYIYQLEQQLAAANREIAAQNSTIDGASD